MVRNMKPGSVIIDVAVDQGGCVATTTETTHDRPVVEHYGVLHYGVGNMPAAVPHTSTYALTNATIPYAVALATHGVRAALQSDPGLAAGLATANGELTNATTAAALGRAAVDPFVALG